MTVKYIAALVLAPWLASSAQAEWHKSEIKDEMRGKVTTVLSQTVSPISGVGPDLALTVLDHRDGKPGVLLRIEEGAVDGCPTTDNSHCEVSIKFDDGDVSKDSFATDDGQSLIPLRMVAFVGTAINAKVLFVEIKIKSFGVRQYKFAVGGLDVSVDRSPALKIFGYELGKSYPDHSLPLKVKRSEGSHVCYEGEGVEGVFGKEKTQQVTMCFYRGVFYSALVTPGSKQSYKEGVKLISAAFGKQEHDSTYPQWPDDGDSVLTKSTKRAAYFSFEKNKYDDPFIISDDVISPLAPSFSQP